MCVCVCIYRVVAFFLLLLCVCSTKSSGTERCVCVCSNFFSNLSNTTKLTVSPPPFLFQRKQNKNKRVF